MLSSVHHIQSVPDVNNVIKVFYDAVEFIRALYVKRLSIFCWNKRSINHK